MNWHFCALGWVAFIRTCWRCKRLVPIRQTHGAQSSWKSSIWTKDLSKIDLCKYLNEFFAHFCGVFYMLMYFSFPLLYNFSVIRAPFAAYLIKWPFKYLRSISDPSTMLNLWSRNIKCAKRVRLIAPMMISYFKSCLRKFCKVTEI